MLVGPIAALTWGFCVGEGLVVAAGLAWLAHVGVDRAMGLGLKYSDGPFHETHLQHV